MCEWSVDGVRFFLCGWLGLWEGMEGGGEEEGEGKVWKGEGERKVWRRGGMEKEGEEGMGEGKVWRRKVYCVSLIFLGEGV